MTTYREWPSDGGPHTSDSIGQALAGLVARDASGNPIPGMIAAPSFAAVSGAWKVQVGRFVYVRNLAGAARFSGLSADEQIDVPNAASIPAGQARIDRIVFDPAVGIVRIPGVVSNSPVAPDDAGLVRVGTVRVNAGDSSVVSGQVVPDFVFTALAGVRDVMGSVPPRVVPTGGTVTVPVVFPVDMFSAPPMVLVGTVGVVRGDTATATNITKNGCDIVLGTAAGARTFGATWLARAS